MIEKIIKKYDMSDWDSSQLRQMKRELESHNERLEIIERNFKKEITQLVTDKIKLEREIKQLKFLKGN